MLAVTSGVVTTAFAGAGADPCRAAELALGVNPPGHRALAKELDQFRALTGRRPAIAMWFQSWSEPLFYRGNIKAADSRKATPMITWEPLKRNVRINLRAITKGNHDRYLRRSARSARRWGRPFYVRFAHEMNGDWYPWGLGVGGNTGRDYRAAWRHVVRVFRREKATNVRWVWAPNVTGGNGVPRFEAQYPGDKFVDWVGLDGYNWGTRRASGWRSLRAIFAPSYAAMKRLTSKPLMISETASADEGGDKAAWIDAALSRDLPALMPDVRAVVWFQREKEADWRVDSTPESLASFRAAVTAPLFSVDRKELLDLID